MTLNKWQRYVGQALLYSALILFIAHFSSSPRYVAVPQGSATVKISVKHSGQIIGACHTLTAEELARLPPNMRAPTVCPRERSVVEFQFLMDDKELYHATLQPAGWRKDGRANLYQRFTLPAGKHSIHVRLKDNAQLADYNYQSSKEVNIKPGSVLVVKFDPEKGEFLFTI